MSDFSGPTEAGWQPDPDGRHEYRYWDGAAWTDQVSDGGVVSTDPPGPSPTAVVPPTTVEQPVYGEQPPVYTGVPLAEGTPPGEKSGVPVGLLALIGLVVAALVVGLVLFLTGGDDSGGDGDEVAATSDITDDASDDASDDQSDDATSDFSDEFTDDSSDDATSDFTDDFTDDSGDSGDVVTANNLQDGDCVLDEATLTGASVTAIDCSESHVFELMGRFDVPGDAFPGADELSTMGQERCTGQIFEDYVGIAYSSSVTYASALPPSQETWEQANDRTILCFAHTSDQTPTTGSVRNSGE